MPSKSAAQAKLMRAVAHNPQFAKQVGIPVSVGQDFSAADQRAGKFGARRKMADGGKVKGRGTGTSDSIPTDLSHGEYVLPADTTQAIGIKRLNAIKAATHKPVKAKGMANGGVAEYNEEYRKKRQKYMEPAEFKADIAAIPNAAANVIDAAILPTPERVQPLGQNDWKGSVGVYGKPTVPAPVSPSVPAPATTTGITNTRSPVQLTNQPLVQGDSGTMRFGAGDVAAINAGIRKRGGSNSFTNIPGAPGMQVPTSSGYVPDQGNVDRLNRMTANYLAERNQPVGGIEGAPIAPDIGKLTLGQAFAAKANFANARDLYRQKQGFGQQMTLANMQEGAAQNRFEKEFGLRQSNAANESALQGLQGQEASARTKYLNLQARGQELNQADQEKIAALEKSIESGNLKPEELVRQQKVLQALNNKKLEYQKALIRAKEEARFGVLNTPEQ